MGMMRIWIAILLGKSGAQNTLDLDVDNTIDGWVDAAGNRWYCSYNDARDYCSNPTGGGTCPAGATGADGNIITMTDAQMDTAYGGQFPNTYPRQGGIGYNAAALSRTGGSCCAANTKVETLFKTCVCDTSYKPTTYPITSLTTSKSETDLSCVGCATLVAAKDTQKYNGITMANFLSDDTTTSCAFKSNLFQPTGTGTEFRCPSTLTTDGNSYVVPSILKCSDPSDQTACLASLACAYCTDVVVPTTGFTFSSVAGQCGCTSSCNSDNSCSENAILNIQNQCECIFETIAALDESSNEKCQECGAANANLVATGDNLRGTGCACLNLAALYTPTSSTGPYQCRCLPNYKMGAIFDSNDDITGYQCVECTSIIDPNTGVAWVSGGAIDCSITAIESEFCGTNMYPKQSGSEWICTCIKGYLKNSAGVCVACSDVMTAEGVAAGFAGGASTSKLIDPTSTTASCSCVSNATPDSSTNQCACNSDSVVSSDYFNTGQDQKACVVKSALTGIGADITDGTCGTNAYVDESGRCACLTTSNTVPGTVSADYIQGSTATDICYRSGTTEKCVKDTVANTEGLLHAKCDAVTGFVFTLNEDCRSADWGFLPNDKFYVGNTASACQLAVSGTHATLTTATSACDIVDDTANNRFTATVKFDNTGLQYSVADMTFHCLKSDYSIDGNDWASVNFSPVEQAFQFTDLTSLVDITFDTSLTYDLNDQVNLVINELITGKFTYRINDVWITTESAGNAYDSIANTEKKFKIFENGCATVPCWASSSNTGNNVQFHAVGFAGDAFPQTIYLSATVLACDINEANSCEAQGCTACGTGYAPTGRKRRSAEHGEIHKITHRYELHRDDDSIMFLPDNGPAIVISRHHSDKFKIVDGNHDHL